MEKFYVRNPPPNEMKGRLAEKFANALMTAWWLPAAGVIAAQTKCDFSALTAKVQGWVDSGYYPGAAVLVAKDQQVIYEKCFGSYTPETPVFIASAGKWLAAAKS